MKLLEFKRAFLDVFEFTVFFSVPRLKRKAVTILIGDSNETNLTGLSLNFLYYLREMLFDEGRNTLKVVARD